MTSFKVLAFLALACMASVAHGSTLSGDDLPEVVGQQRSLLAASAAAGYYTPKPPKPRNQRKTVKVALLIRAPKRLRILRIPISYKVGANTLIKRIRRVQRKYNKAYKAHNNFKVKYFAGPKKIKGQAWVIFKVSVDIGPPGAPYKKALRRALRKAIRSKSKYVIKVRGGSV